MKWRQSFLLLLTGLCPLAHSVFLPPQYHFISLALPWLKAQMYCRERYTDLATVFNTEDMNRLVNAAQDSTGGVKQKAWIGLHDNLTSWRWSFSDNYYSYYRGVEDDYRNWDYGQPDNFLGDQMCVKMLSGGVWEDSRCFLQNPFICYDGTNSTSERFIFVEQEMSWPDAQNYCRTRFTDLASIRDKTENQEIQLLAKKRSVWIGLYRTREWSDRSYSAYRNWKDGQPDNVEGRQSCTATDLGNAGLWSDEQCDTVLAFICYGEKEVDETPRTTSTTTPKTTSTTTPRTTSTTTPRTTSTTTLRTTSTTTPRTTSTTTPRTTSTTTPRTTSTTTPTTTSTTTPTTTTSTTTLRTKSTTTLRTTSTTTPRTTSTTTPTTTSTTTPTTTSTTTPTTTSATTPTTTSTTTLTTTSTMTNPTTERDSISTMITSSERLSTSEQHQTSTPEHVIYLGVAFTSKIQLSDDDIKKLVLVKFRNLLIEMGLPTNIKVGLRRPLN
ncbi:putative GPI-anchored protein pfl2 [Seriola lalandi dorsalis]|uniref:putative GPI-anchored protein pfl2 n=1 Tax=Seriola lalandi dorsalis TaxID=1841481 RepID=UPI000C6F910E|nr:putative GPI-anchored protein pfl2 [Seriola lalandi dorsalis]